MSRKDDRASLSHMLDHAREILEMTRDRTAVDLETDRKRELSVLHLLALTGETSRRVSRALRDSHPEIPWRDVAGMRNFLIHAYDEVHLPLVWETVTTRLPPLVRRLEQILS